MLRRSLMSALLVLLVFAVPAATADEPLPKGAEGTFELHGSHGYKVFGLIASTGKSGRLALFVGKQGAGATYSASGEVTREHVHFDLGRLGEVDVAVQSTGRMEAVRSDCGKPLEIEGEEYVGTIAFHGEEGFAEAEATRTPLRLKPVLDLVCGGGVGQNTLSGGRLPGAQLLVRQDAGPFLRLDQNHAGAKVFYEAKMSEKDGSVRVNRSVEGYVGGGALTYSPSLDAARFSAGAPFSGSATYRGKRPPWEARPGTGSWRGTLKVDFPGAAAVPLAGHGFTASIVHAKRTETRR